MRLLIAAGGPGTELGTLWRRIEVGVYVGQGVTVTGRRFGELVIDGRIGYW